MFSDVHVHGFGNCSSTQSEGVHGSPPNPAYDVRFDLNASGAVNLSDVVAMGPFFNKACTP